MTMVQNWKMSLRNIHYLKFSSAVLLGTSIMFLISQIWDTNLSERCNKYMTLMSNVTSLTYNASGTPYGHHRRDNSVMSVQDIATELLLKLQNGELSERFRGPEWRELLDSLKSSLKSEMDLNEESVNRNSGEEIKACQAKTNIFFLKTHKTASSTIMNILFRYGEFHNLNFAFPVHSAQYFYPKFFSASYVDGFSKERNKTFNIMCHHMRFQLTEVENVMPHDTFYFTILRNPITQMESSFSYYKNFLPFKKAKNLEDFLNNSHIYYNTKEENSNYAKNLMTFDLGFDPNGPETIKHLQLTFQAIDTMFNLVLITEYFYESLVLLKDALCWTFDDVLSFPLNSRSNTTKKTLSLKTQDNVKNWNNLDWQLYVHFNNSFWKRVERFGRERMQREVEELQRMITQLTEKCLQGKADSKELQDKSLKPFQSGIAKILGYNLKPGLSKAYELLCQRLVTPELQYNAILHDMQRRAEATMTQISKTKA